MQQEIYSDYLRLIAGREMWKLRVVVLVGLPGCGKSTLAGILQQCFGYRYVSTDRARVEMMKLTKSKYSTSQQYVMLKGDVYKFVREMTKDYLRKKQRVVVDATHMNEQLPITVDYLSRLGVVEGELLIVYVEGGSKEHVRARFVDRGGRNRDGRTWVEAWEQAYDYFTDRMKQGLVKIPENKVGRFEVVWVKNY
jgi:adenylate kinase family enzyme